jgi:hypothetical protein
MNGTRRERLIQLLGMTGSRFDPEALNAIRLAERLLAEEKMTWREVFNMPAVGSRTDMLLQQQNQRLEQRVAELERENARLRRDPAGRPLGDHQKQARWVFELHAAAQITLTSREYETMGGWLRLPTERQQAWLRNV